MGKFSIVILDFETSGLSPDYGDRPIEIGAVLIRNNQIVERFQSLMNPGFKVSSFIEDYTGISNRMLQGAPSCSEVMKKFASFMSDHHLAAHNASFDSKFLDTELNRLNLRRNNDIVCTMLAARRIYQNAPNHQLETLVSHLGISVRGQFHRALADAEMTASLWLKMVMEIKTRYRINPIPFKLIHRLTKVPKSDIATYMKRHATVDRYVYKAQNDKKSIKHKKPDRIKERLRQLFPGMPREVRESITVNRNSSDIEIVVQVWIYITELYSDYYLSSFTFNDPKDRLNCLFSKWLGKKSFVWRGGLP